jgi:endoglucanase
MMNAAKAQNATPIFVAYNIPNRDCSGYSAGGATTASAYQSWINGVAAGIGNNPAVVILEPDALSSTGCLSGSELSARVSMLRAAVGTLKSHAATKVYLDAGHSGWVDASTMANLLTEAGVGNANGFALNVSNFTTTASNIDYGSQVSAKTNGAHFVIDTSRNGNGPTSDNQWCNPSGRAIGTPTTSVTGNALVDGLLWLKTPGESDGTCNGGPSAGVWWPSYALSLVKNSL